MGKPLNCDETEEIRTILYKIKKILVEADNEFNCGTRSELSAMVLDYIPMIEQSYKNFVERSVME